LSFEKFLDQEMANDNFNKAQYIKNSKERQNLSKIRLDSDSGCTYLSVGELYTGKYSELTGPRYVACLDITYDILLGIYDDNNKLIAIYRHTRVAPDAQLIIEKMIRTARNANFEARLIGMQDGQSQYLINDDLALLKKFRIPLFEIDLFGTDLRHVAFDLKTGISFDVLVENRLYKPGELVNKTTLEQFERVNLTQPAQGKQLTKKQKTSKKI
jgi:hypothetical protein